MKKTILLVLLLIAGCETMTPEQREAYREQQEQRQKQAAEAYVNSLGNTCLSLGYQRHTPEIRDCMLKMHQSNLAQQQADRSAAIGYLLQQQQSPATTTTNCQHTFMGVQCTTR